MPARIAAGFRDPPVRLAISPVRRTSQVGQPIAVRVVATGRRDASIREAWAVLVMKVWWRTPQVVAGNWGSAPGSAAPHRTVTGGRSPLRLTGDLRAGARSECEVALPNWAQAPTGGQPSRKQLPGRRIEYVVRAEVKLASGRTVRGEAPVVLLSGPELYQGVEGTHRSRRARRCDIELIAPALRGRPDEILRGTIRVTPRQPVRARSVLLCVLRTQNVPPRQSVMWRRTLASDADLSSSREFGFAAPVPRVPTMITPDLYVRWHLRVVVRYGRFAADRLDTELNVYTGPP